MHQKKGWNRREPGRKPIKINSPEGVGYAVHYISMDDYNEENLGSRNETENTRRAGKAEFSRGEMRY